MSENKGGGDGPDSITLASEIVAAYVSNNKIDAADVPALISNTANTIAGLRGKRRRIQPRPRTGGAYQQIDHPGFRYLPGRRQEAENAQALFAHALQSVSGRISAEMGTARRLSDDRAQLFQEAVERCEVYRARQSADKTQGNKKAVGEKAQHEALKKKRPVKHGAF